MHGTVTFSAGSLGLWRTKLLFGFVRSGVGLLFARASDVVPKLESNKLYFCPKGRGAS